MRLVDYLVGQIDGGISYEDARDLCMALYSRANLLDAQIDEGDLSMEGIAAAFSEISRQGFINGYSPLKAVSVGASYHAIVDKGHWIEVQASILKLKTRYDPDRVKQLLATWRHSQ